MSGSDPATPVEGGPVGRGDARTRRSYLIAGASSGVGLGLALATGLAGGEGRLGVAVWLLVSALGSGAGALYATVTLLVDDLKGRHPGGRRAVAAAVLFILSAALMAMVAGMGG